MEQKIKFETKQKKPTRNHGIILGPLENDWH